MEISQDENLPKRPLSPMMVQYNEIKAQCQDSILLFRMGDFYELFDTDAVKAAPIIGLTLTSRNKKSGDTTPMCGFPHHSMAGPIQKLLAAGLRVAICDQVEDPALAKGLVKRQITRRLSPGMVYDPDTLDQRVGHYMMSFDQDHIVFLDSTTAEAFYYKNDQDFEYYFEAFNIVEIILSDETIDFKPPGLICVTYTKKSSSEGAGRAKPTEERLSELDSDCRELLLSYVKSTQGETFLRSFDGFKYFERSKTLTMSAKVFKHLEIFKNYEGDTLGSLFETINKTTTPAGSRKLKTWLRQPLSDVKEISRRHDEIEMWSKDFLKLKKMRELLKNLGDLERRTLKITSPSCGPRDLLRLSDSLEVLMGLQSFMPFDEQVFQSVVDIQKLISSSIEEDSPVQFSSGQFIQMGFSRDLDEVIELADNAQGLVQKMELREKEATQVSSLKIRYNSVFGFYIEVSKVHTSKIPSHYVRKQTLVSSERYTTEELQTLEEKVLLSKTKRIELELLALSQIKEKVLIKSKDFLRLCVVVAEVDALSALAWLSIERKYVRPEFSLDGSLKLLKSRHPVVEFSRTRFIANDINLDQGQCLLITGPNMAGKSTVMRQVVLAVVLNQMGSFVPATKAVMPIYKTLHTRIGASDFLSQGLSTFMVEMSETAELLDQAGPDSLIILDEIGRGTSTYDGLSLAQAILEELVDKGASFMFSTHYQELTSLVAPRIVNMNMGVKKEKDKIFFEYLFKLGAAEKSYGIEVAKIAGVKDHVIQRAQQLLVGYEKKSSSEPAAGAEAPTKCAERASELDSAKEQSSFTSCPADSASQLSLLFDVPPPSIDPKILELIEKVKSFSTDESTPMQALNEISKWQKNL